jgi:hypothetical protein
MVSGLTGPPPSPPKDVTKKVFFMQILASKWQKMEIHGFTQRIKTHTVHVKSSINTNLIKHNIYYLKKT